jgi:UrcA family protein
MTKAGKLLIGTAVSFMSLAGATAYADPSPVETHSLVVHLADLNLDRMQDVAKLYKRISVAADRACGPSTLTGSYYKTADYESCYTDAVAKAVAHIDQPSVTDYYRQRLAEPTSLNDTIAKQ